VSRFTDAMKTTEHAAAKLAAVPPPTARVARKAPTKAKATYLLPAALVDEARDAAVALSGPPHRLTLAALVENAIRRELDRLKKAHTNGKPFPKHAGPLVGGRPITR
jgi:hypothetical protein